MVHEPTMVARLRSRRLLLKTVLIAVGGAIQCARAAVEGRPAFGLLRPPGHHADQSGSWGFCYVNNMAIAVRKLRQEADLRWVVIVDLDHHVGDGTQRIFASDSRILVRNVEAVEREEYLERRYGLETELIDKSSDKSLDNDLRAILFRNVRELFTNIIKHSKAKKVNILLENSAGEYIITITDDGIGFDPAAVSRDVKLEKKFGLFSIQERMSDLGGALEILSEPGNGSQIIMSVPFDNSNSKKKA